VQADSVKLRELASWYREQAERAANPVIWEARLQIAEDLEAEADRLEGKLVPIPAFWNSLARGETEKLLKRNAQLDAASGQATRCESSHSPRTW
jgi:hypothetical protein